jgi:hypothetical protein
VVRSKVEGGPWREGWDARCVVVLRVYHGLVDVGEWKEMVGYAGITRHGMFVLGLNMTPF